MTFRNCLKLLDFHLSTDYENFLSSMRTSTYLKVKLTVNFLLSANTGKLSINIYKSNFVIFHPVQNQIP